MTRIQHERLRPRALSLLALAFLTAACSGVTGDMPLLPRPPTNPPALKAAPTTEPKTAQKPVKAATKPRAPTIMWYERYDLGDVVVTVDEGMKGQMNGANQPSYPREIYENPGLAAYERRLAVLRREQKALLEENARLRNLQPAQGADVSLLKHSPLPKQKRELLELQSWLAELSAGQAEVVAQTQTMVAQHGALLAQLRRTLPEQLAQLEQP